MGIVTAYTPRDPLIIAVVAGIGVAIYLLGLAMQRRPAKGWHVGLAWIGAIAAVVLIERLSTNEPPGVRMVVLIAALLWSMKLVVITSARLGDGPTLPAGRWLAFLFGWPGMQPAIFAKAARPNFSLAGKFLGRGLVRIAAGLGLMFVARRWMSAPDQLPYGDLRSGAATLILLTGISLILHFGLFNLLAAGWQAVGLNCQPVFRAPLVSTSLSEFWSRRWNLAFSEMTAIAVYRPLHAQFGTSAAVLAGFAFSGVVHELAITVPVMSGFGGPLGYFLLHGVLVLLERRFGWPGRCGAWYRIVILISLVGPLPWLFPPVFLREIVWPLAGIEP